MLIISKLLVAKIKSNAMLISTKLKDVSLLEMILSLQIFTLFFNTDALVIKTVWHNYY